MTTIRGALRDLVMSPALVDVTFAKRGFPAEPSAVTEHLEAVPQAVICGFEWGIAARNQWEVERRLDMVDPGLRGFAYEGTTMAFTILDSMGRGHRTRDLLLGPGRPHIFLAYIGMGFAMARLPRPVWKKVLPDLTGMRVPPDHELARRRRIRLRPGLLRHQAMGGRAVHAVAVPVGRRARLLPARRGPGHRPGAVVHLRRERRLTWLLRSGGSPATGTRTCGAGWDWPPRSPAAATPAAWPRCAVRPGSTGPSSPWASCSRSRRGPTPASCRPTPSSPARPWRTCPPRRPSRSPTAPDRTAAAANVPAYEVWRQNIRARLAAR